MTIVNPNQPIPSATKGTARYINDTLFASNIGAVLISVNGYSSNPANRGELPETESILFSIFFFLFRIKAYLDDNYSLMLTDIDLKEANRNPDSWEKISFAISFFCWISFTIGGFFIFTKPLLSHVIMLSFFVIFSIWIILNMVANKKEEKNHLWFLVFNLFYCLLLLIIITSHFKAFTVCRVPVGLYVAPERLIWFGVAGFLLLFFDYFKSGSLDNSYR